MIHLPWIHKPPYGVKLNRSHPLTQGLVACWLFNEYGGDIAYDMCSKFHGDIITLGNDIVSWYAEYLRNETRDSADYVDVGAFPQLSRVSIATDLKPNSGESGSYDRVIHRGNSDGYGFVLRHHLNTFIFLDHRVTASTNLRTPTIVANESHHIVATSDRDTNQKLYMDGVNCTGTMTDRPGSTSSDLVFFRRSNTISNSFGGGIKYIYIWDKVLTEAEAVSLYINPYQIFAPLFNIGVDPEAAGGSVLLPININGIAKANIGKINGVTFSNLGSINGVS